MLLLRRHFLKGAFGLSLTGVAGAHAQTPPKLPEIGFVYEGIAPAAAVRAKAFQEGLRSKGYDEGRNIVTAVRSAESRSDQFEPLVRELLQRNVRLLFTIGPAVTRLAAAATKSIPIVTIDLESDPVRDGLIQNVARPGGNLTGMFFDFPDFARKWIQLLAEAVPNLARMTIFWDTATGKHQLDAVSDEARSRGIVLQILQVASPTEFEASFAAAAASKSQALLVLSSPLFGTQPKLVADLAIRHRLPAIMFYPEFARVGGLMAYGTNLIDLFFQAGVLVAKILDGEQTAALPVERPSRFQLVANLKTAALLGVTMPTSILLRADEFIE